MAKKIKSYDSALEELEQIVASIQEGTTSIDTLETLIKRATELKQYCEAKLRDTQETLNDILDTEGE